MILDAVEPAPEIDPMPALSLPLQIAHVEMQRKPLARVPTRVAATLLIVVLAGCSGLFAIWHRAEEMADLTQIAQAASSESSVATSIPHPVTNPASETDTSAAPDIDREQLAPKAAGSDSSKNQCRSDRHRENLGILVLGGPDGIQRCSRSQPNQEFRPGRERPPANRQRGGSRSVDQWPFRWGRSAHGARLE